MRRIARGLGTALLALLLLALLALALAVEDRPRVPQRDEVSPADVDRAVALVRQHDPRASPPGRARVLSLTERDLDLLARYAARRWLGAAAQARLQPQRLLLQASLAALWSRWINVELVLRQADGAPRIERLQVGRLPLPVALALPALRASAARRALPPDAWLAAQWIERASFDNGALVLSYRIDPDTLPRLRAALVDAAQQQRLRAYQERLARLTHDAPRRDASLAALLGALIELAAARSAAGGDAAAENRAALTTLAFFANQQPLARWLPAAHGWPQPLALVVNLRQRHDTAQHFLISAVIAAEAGTPLADAVGLWKELADARRGGSGFSFNDLAADRAGTRFGELAVRDATRLQRRVAAGVRDADLLPEVADLPENLPEQEFVGRYGGVGGAGYERMRSVIESRIDALPWYR
jgi:uncharacterized protein YfiM (DUF2279 family)